MKSEVTDFVISYVEVVFLDVFKVFRGRVGEGFLRKDIFFLVIHVMRVMVPERMVSIRAESDCRIMSREGIRHYSVVHLQERKLGIRQGMCLVMVRRIYLRSEVFHVDQAEFVGCLIVRKMKLEFYHPSSYSFYGRRRSG